MSSQTPLGLDEWINSMRALLASVDRYHIQSYSISIVPEGLKESNKDHHHPVKKQEEYSRNKHEGDVYMPRVVSMGPRFKDTSEDLLPMEEVKLRCMLSLIHRAGTLGDGPLYLDKCCRVIWDLDGEIRASYFADINHIKTPDLAKIMLVDGCFLLELLISKGSLNDQLPCRLKTPPPAPQVLQNEDVLCDLILFENQIPMCVLLELSRTLFPDVFEENLRDRAIRINNLALAIFGYDQLPRDHQTSAAPHILDAVHFFVNRERSPHSKTANDVVVDIPIWKLNLKQQSASSLLAAGIPIKVAQETKTRASSCFSFLRNCFGGMSATTRPVDVPTSEETVNIKGLDFDFKFQNGELEIEQLHIKNTTKVMWRNIIAWDHHHKKVRTKSPNGKFTSAAWIFYGLIGSRADVKLLKDKNVIVNHTEMSDEELVAFFQSMTLGVDYGIVDSKWVKLVKDLRNYSRAFYFIRMWRGFCELLRWSLKLFIKGITKTYGILISLVAFLTLVQTVYAILAYHHPPK